MGMTSWNCVECGESIKAPGFVTFEDWESECVAISEGFFARGTYDGYGRIAVDIGDDDPNPFMVGPIDVAIPTAFYHTQCWHKAGKPTLPSETPHPSSMAMDQGFIVED